MTHKSEKQHPNYHGIMVSLGAVFLSNFEGIGIMKFKKTLSFLALGLSTITLVACGGNKTASSKVTSVAEADEQQSVNKDKKEHQQSSEKKSAQLWTVEKDKQLEAFMGKWVKTMGQAYVKYDGEHPLKVSVGGSYPDLLADEQVDGESGRVGWSNDGSGNHEYNVVAIYNHDGNLAPLPNRITYLFAFKNGQPIVLCDQSRDGDPRSGETQNTALKEGFAKIVGATAQNANNRNSSEPSNQSNKSIDPKRIGVMVRMETPAIGGTKEDIANDSNLGIAGHNNEYTIGERSVMSTNRYSIEGNMVHYWTLDRSHGESLPMAKQIEHTISVKELESKYYSLPKDKKIVDSIVSHLKDFNTTYNN